MSQMLSFLRSLSRAPAPDGTRHFYWLDLVRGCASLTILVWHYQHFYYQTAGKNPIVYSRDVQPLYSALSLLYNDGYFAVQLFWVISGFVFAAVYANAPTSGREFFVNRLARLYPLHFATLVVVALLQALSFGLYNEFQIYENNDAYHFVLNLLFISHWGFEAGDSFNAPIWSVSVEVFIYIVFWLSLKRLFRFGVLGPLAMTCLFGVLFVLKVPGRFWECGFLFFLGSSVYVWAALMKGRNAWNVALGLAGTLLSSIVLALDVSGLGNLGRAALFSSVVLLAAAIDFGDVRQVGKRGAAIGDLSYSLYLLHVPVQISLILFMDWLGVDRSVDKGVQNSPLMLVSFIGLMLVLATVSYRYFELPARRWVRRRFGAPRAAETRNPTRDKNEEAGLAGTRLP